MNVLLVEDDNSHAELIQRSLTRTAQLTVLRAPNGSRALSLLEDRPVHAVVLDYSLPDRDGLDVLHDIRTRHVGLPVIFLTAADSAEVCAKALKAGAVDYLVKKRNYLDVLPLVVSQACGTGATHLAALARRSETTGDLIGESAAMARLRTSIVRAAGSHATVLVGGETGSGKELVAQAIHAASARAAGPFVPINCSEIAETLFESALFGHVRGAFTGAVADRKGLLESANGGTIFLDEVEDLAAGPQAKLLRVLQTREFRPVGSTRLLRFDARVIAAANQDLEALVEEGRMRRDLYFRLNVLSIRVPTLRERREDVPVLAAHFIRRFNERNGTRFGGISPAAAEALRRRAWPGNVRELENVIERTLVNSFGDTIDEAPIFGTTLPADVSDERAAILLALQRNRWNRERTAVELGISRITLWRKMRRLELYG